MVRGASTSVELTADGELADSKSHLRLVKKSSSEPDQRVAWPFEEKADPDWSPRAIRRELDEVIPPNVRREDSVIAEINAARNEPLWKVGAVARRMSTQIRGAVDVLHDSSRGALRRFESLPRSKQIMWVAAPYVGAAFLVGLLMALDDEESVEISAVPVPAAIAAKPAPKPVQAKVVEAPSLPAPAAPKVERETHQLPVHATLYARPDSDLKVARVKPQLLTVYPDFPTEEGWVLVVTEKGTVGYLEKARLDGDPEPKKGKKKKVRPRRRK